MKSSHELYLESQRLELANLNNYQLMSSTRQHNDKIVSSHKMPTPQNRILLDTPCKVCGDNSSGKHYGIHTCDGCSGFFKRSIRKQKAYPCKSGDNSCPITRSCRNQCRSCRLNKCREMGMLEESVQQERGPRNSTSGSSSARATSPNTTMRMHAREYTGGVGPLRGSRSSGGGGGGGGGRSSLGNCAISHAEPYPTSRLMMPTSNNIPLLPATTTTSSAAPSVSASQLVPPELPHLAAAAYHHHLLSQLTPQLQDPTSHYNQMLYRYMAQLAGHMSNNPHLL